VLVTAPGGARRRPGGVKPGEPGHDPSAVSPCGQPSSRDCRILGVTHLERLGITTRDDGWEQNEAPDNFWNTPVDVRSRSAI